MPLVEEKKVLVNILKLNSEVNYQAKYFTIHHKTPRIKTLSNDA
jgi:hypothetical protein